MLREDFVIAVHNKDGNFVVGVNYDGSVKYGDAFTSETAAKEFWEHFSRYVKKEFSDAPR